MVIDLIYTNCVDSCPLMTARLAQVQQMLGDRVGKDIFFYSISIDPDRDTPAVLKAYAGAKEVTAGVEGQASIASPAKWSRAKPAPAWR